VHHTDAEREYAYDRKSHVGTLDKVLDDAAANGWIIVDMKEDWNTIFPKVELEKSRSDLVQVPLLATVDQPYSPSPQRRELILQLLRLLEQLLRLRRLALLLQLLALLL